MPGFHEQITHRVCSFDFPRSGWSFARNRVVGMTVHIIERGNPNAPQTLIFIHGWPDTEQVFEQQVAYFEKKYRVVLFVLPGYRKDDATPFFGFDMLAVIKQLAAAIGDAMKNRREKPILIVHDWGAVLTHAVLIDNPSIAEKCVFLDIGCHIQLNAKAILFAVVYQITLLVLFLLPAFIGTPLTKAVASLLGVAPKTRARIHAGMNYLYLQSWKRRLSGTEHVAYKGWHPPALPVLYLYGTKKPIFFHSQKWLSHLDATAGSKQRGFAGGHWFFNSSKFVPEVNAEIERFIEAKP